MVNLFFLLQQKSLGGLTNKYTYSFTNGELKCKTGNYPVKDVFNFFHS